MDNQLPSLVYLSDCLKNIQKDKYELPICLGRDSDGEILIKDFKDLGGLLISGVTSSGKSVFINSFINTILLTKEPEQVKFIMIDLKGVELHPYNGIKHLLYPVCDDAEKAIQLIEWCMKEIERRKKENKNKPYILLLIDEFSDLMLCDENTNSKLVNIAKEGNTVGIHMLLSSSIPRITIFTPELKDAISTRMVGFLATSIDSKELIEDGNAIDLLGQGDMIFKDVKSGDMKRIQTPFISTEEQELILKSVSKVSEYKEIELKEIADVIDPLFEDAKKLTIENRKASASFLQRKLVISYNRASRLINQLEEVGIIGFQVGTKPREILVDKYESDGKGVIVRKDPVIEDAKKLIKEYGFASVTLLQRKLKIGYNQAARLFYRLEAESIIGKKEKGSIRRKVLI